MFVSKFVNVYWAITWPLLSNYSLQILSVFVMKSFVREGAGGRSTMMDVQGTDWLLTFLNNVT